MKKALTVLIISLLLINLFPFSSHAANKSTSENTIDLSTSGIARSSQEKNILKSIYQKLYPDQYHYIEEYEAHGVKDLPKEEIKIIYSGSRKWQGKTYDLIVFSNGQIFTNFSEVISEEVLHGPMTRGAGVGATVRRTEKFTTGEFGKYIYFYVDYTIDYTGIDWINKLVDAKGSGFYLFPTNYTFKMNEDNKKPAFVGYRRVRMTGNTTNVLYDIGVAVGQNKARAVTVVSSGLDILFWNLLYEFLKV